MELDNPTDVVNGQNEDGGGESATQNLDEPSEHPGNGPRPTINPNWPPRTAPENPPKRHGYAAIEVHKGGARIIRWEVVETRKVIPEQSEQQRRLFRLGEWLSKQPISDQARAEYFDIERVSYVEGRLNKMTYNVSSLSRIRFGRAWTRFIRWWTHLSEGRIGVRRW
jgi:hypothetical protein